MRMQILIVEDDRRLARQLKKGLDELGHSASIVFEGLAGLEAARAGDFDVAVLDVMLPGLDGLSIVRRFRQEGGATPILLLTGRDAPEDIVNGLDAGADDYLTKPFSFKILEARLRALARRKRVDPRPRLKIDDLVLDPATHDVRRGESLIPLSRTEFVLLELFIRNPDRVMTRGRLIEAIWGHDREVQNNTLDVLIRQLRSKIEPPGSTKLLHTIRGVGYCLREEETP